MDVMFVSSLIWPVNDNSCPEGLQTESFTSYYGLAQVINEPTHLLSKPLSCIDLIFTTQNLVTHSGVHSCHHKNCHHQINFAKFDLYIEYSPSYEHLVWNYKQADTLFIQRAISMNLTGKMHSLTLTLIKKLRFSTK